PAMTILHQWLLPPLPPAHQQTIGALRRTTGKTIHQLFTLQIALTVTVDKVAASGGYMMACVADKIVSAPFAIVGS
ncbi:S49 family peptidase, partial [Citrobacter portucalensis]|nr:S49 family peptidase [Citrobacter portucalensis]